MARFKTQADVKAELQKLHDGIMHHPYGMTFSEFDADSYRNLLLDLPRVWSSLLSCDDTSREEHRKLMQFFDWTHNYNKVLGGMPKGIFPKRYFPYFQQVVSLAHRYLETGCYDEYYKLDYIKDPGEKFAHLEPTKYQYITKELCGIDSPELPRYYPVSDHLCVDDEAMKKYLRQFLALIGEKDAKGNVPDAKVDAAFAAWLKDTKPVLEWVNANFHKGPTAHQQPEWQSQPSRATYKDALAAAKK